MAIYIHIGGAKTGSTAIQKMLYLNRPILRKNNFIYHHFNRKDSHELALALGFGVLKNKRVFPKLKINKEKLLSHFLKGLNAKKNHIISSEVFTIAPTQESVNELFETLKSHEVKIVYYVRNQIEQTSSAYHQLVKEGYPHPANVFAQNHTTDIKENLEYFLQHLPQKNFIVRYYHYDSFFNSNIFDDFITALGLQNLIKSLKHPDYKENNQSLPKNCTEVLRLCNQKFPKKYEYFYKELSNLNLKEINPSEYYSEEKQLDLFKNFDTQIKWLKATFTNHNFPEKIEEKNRINQIYSGLDIDGFIPIFMGLIQKKQPVIERLETDLLDYINLKKTKTNEKN